MRKVMVMKREYNQETGKREPIDSHEAWFHGFGEESNGEGCHDVYAIAERCDNGIVEMHEPRLIRFLTPVTGSLQPLTDQNNLVRSMRGKPE